MITVRKTTVVSCNFDENTKKEFDVYIGRLKNTNDHYGNPFVLGKDGSRDVVIEKFRQWLDGTDYRYIEPERRVWILNNMYTLKGKRLGCYCAPEACHGDIYVGMLD